MAYKYDSNAVINVATNKIVLFDPENHSDKPVNHLMLDTAAALNAAELKKGASLTGFDEIGVCCDVAKAHGTQYLADNRHNRKRYPNHGW